MATRGISAFLKTCATRGSCGSLDLKFEHQIDALWNELFGVLDGDIGIVSVIENDQLNTGCGCSGGNALSHSNGEGHFRTLNCEAKAQTAGTRNEPVLPILRLRNIAPMHQGFQDAVDTGFGDTRLLVNVFQRDGSWALFQQLDYIVAPWKGWESDRGA